MTVRVLLVDDHPVVLDGVAGALGREADLAVVGRAASVAEARAILGGRAVDVVLVDIRLPDGSGLELLSESVEAGAGRGPGWIVLSSFETPQYVAAALSLGASGYLLKTAPAAEIAAAVRAVAAGGSAFSSAQLAGVREAGPLRLSPTDLGIVAGLVAGRSNDEIAGDLGIARKTVETHLTRLFAAYDVASRLELAVRAEREGWLDVPLPDDWSGLGRQEHRVLQRDSE
ncbi:MAG TPA: response regulator transcription factor [Candidatus Limnocylindrales bacterium]